jgi:hypothetical protein
VTEEQFRKLLNDGMQILEITDKEIAHAFGVSLQTVAYWRLGAAEPHPEMQASVLHWLINRGWRP